MKLCHDTISFLDKVEDQNILDSVHNCVYFAVAVLQDIQRCEMLNFILTWSLYNFFMGKKSITPYVFYSYS